MDGGAGPWGGGAAGPGEHSHRASRALQRLVEVDPAFGSLSLWCAHRDAPLQRALLLERSEDGWSARPVLRDVAAAFTDGRTVFYGARFETWTLDEQVGVCAHELLHIALRHVPRGRDLRERLGARFRPDLHNVAADAIINETLRAAGHSLPASGVFLSSLLRDVLGESMAPAEALRTWDTETLYARLMEVAETGGAKAEALDRILLVPGPWRDLAAGEAPGPSDLQDDLEWQGRLDRALALGQMAGRGLGALGYRIADIPRSRTPWELLLRRAVSKAVMGVPKPDWSRPSRRFLARLDDAARRGRKEPPFEPRIAARPDAKRVAVGIDVSGSIGDALLHRFAGEIAGIARRTGAEIHVLVFDTAVRSATRIEATDLVRAITQIEFARGGGTSFVDVVDEAAALDPSIIVILTDLHGPSGDAPKGVPVLWCVPASVDAGAAPRFGRVIGLDF